MELKELRLGNYYFNQSGELEGKAGEIGRIEKAEDFLFVDLMLPIPVTEDLLLRFGFEEVIAEDDDDEELYSALYVHDYGVMVFLPPDGLPTIQIMRQVIDEEMELAEEGVYEQEYEELHVHTLQNFAFAITGEELTLADA